MTRERKVWLAMVTAQFAAGLYMTGIIIGNLEAGLK